MNIETLWTTRQVSPAYTVDRDRLGAALASIAYRVDRPVFYGDLSVDTHPLRVRAVPPRPGRVLEQRATARFMLTELGRSDRSAVSLPVRTKQGVTKRQVEGVVRQARAYLGKPLRLAGGGTSTTVTPRRLARVLAVERVRGTDDPAVRLGVDAGRTSKLVTAIRRRVNRAATSTRVVAPARPVVVDEKGDVSWRPRSADVRVTPAKRGWTLRKAATARAITTAVRSGDHAATLPVRDTRPEVPTKAARKVDSLIATFTIYHRCCEPRVTNIHLIAETVDGTVIMPGDQFSLNGVAGRRTRAKGYLPAPFIRRGKEILDVGGGVSQFSTTTYNAAYFAGLQVDHHQPHSE